MRIAFLVLIILHGLIHFLGFLKGFGIADIKELSLTISKPVGLIWLATGLLFLVYGISWWTGYKFSWLLAFIAVVVSQVLVILYWKDAKAATLPNLIILVVAIVSLGSYNFNKMVQTDTNRILYGNKVVNEKVVSKKDLEGLPQPVQKWLRHSGIIGKPFISNGKILQDLKMKMKPGQEKWLQATAVQYSTVDVPAFIWSVDARMNSLIGFKGRDKFEGGKGEMLIKLEGLVNVVDEKGEKLDEGSLQRYLGEMVWLPTLALSPHVSWEEVNDCTAIATLDYMGTKGSGTFTFNSDGDFTIFSAMRFKGNEADAKRYPWVLKVQEHKSFEDIRVPSKMTATWKLENQDWTWLKLDIKNIDYNVKAPVKNSKKI
ncbi:DUF6544 family protein [Salinimicrobium sediminilitoris]|uniref:DUF6544 family protein n=1 Tax=Salinimicrobium sediminilitoris TaxID=2876715 RepID=UPI001E3EBBA1|nr:DUF6544 family protein [Salinimicrobium sediminilitoris]MCC8361098.1 hypothetical protein [Salinimicrobium sediminilitoris]